MNARYLAVVLALPLAACGGRYETYSLSGGAAMRIDVEVYKGPLSAPVSGQIGQMGAVITESVRAAAQWHDGAAALGKSLYGPKRKNPVEEQVAAIAYTATRMVEPGDPARAALAREQIDQLLQKELAKIVTQGRAKLANGRYDDQSPLSSEEVTQLASAVYGSLSPPAASPKTTDTVDFRISFVEKLVQASTDAEKLQARQATLIDQEQKLCTIIDNGGRANGYADQATARQDCHVLADSLTIARQTIMAGCRLLSQDETIKLLGQPAYLPITTCERFGFTRTIYGDMSTSLTVRESTAAGGETETTIATFDPNDTRKEGIRDSIKRVLGSAETALRNESGNGFSEQAIEQRLKNAAGGVVIAVDNYAALLRSAGFRTSFANVRYVPQDRQVRSAVVALSLITAEYGNQVQGRITTLARQIVDGRQANLLSTADFLRDSSNTKFLRMAEWLDAGVGGNPGGLDVADRARLAQSLTNDFYWQPVNTVHASGRGDVAMAFVKDSIGNWDLKSFDNDPSDLLAAYRSVTDAAIKATLKLAGSAVTAGATTGADAMDGIAAAKEKIGLAERMRKLASDASSTTSGDGGSADQVQRLRQRLLGEIAELKLSWQTRPKALTDQLADKVALLTTAKSAHDNAKEALGKASEDLDAAIAASSTCDATITGQCAAALAKVKSEADAHSKAKLALSVEEARLANASLERDAAKKAVDGMEAEARAALATLLDKQGAVLAALEDLAVSPAPSPPSPAPSPLAPTPPASQP